MSRFTTRRIMVLVGAAAVGLAACPRSAWYLGLITPAVLAVVLRWPGALLLPAALLLAPCAFLEVGVGMPVPLWVYLPLGIAAAGGVFPWRACRERPARLAAAVVVALAVAGLYLVPWTTRKPFLKRLDSIQPGMTEADVRRRMRGYMEGASWTTPEGGALGVQGALVFRHFNAPAFNSDWGVVYFLDGRVTRVEFSPD